jgi:4-hydroxy-tetrahydrodipicolinate reductase
MPVAAPNSAPLRLVLIGATGRMGQAVLRALPSYPRLVLAGAIGSPASRVLGRDAGELAGVAAAGVPVSADLAAALRSAAVAIDFSTASATRDNLAACRAARAPLLICSTGYPAAHESEFAAAAHDIALLTAANTSVAVTLMTELVRLAAYALPPTFDVDVVDIHHRDKRDAPSGTALALGAVVREARAAASSPGAGRDVAFASVRAGDVAGEHSVHFSGPGEQLTLEHRSSDRAVYARGALAAALWLAAQAPGRYSMRDVLGLKTVT